MQRRQALHDTTWILATTIFGPGLMTSLQSCKSESTISDKLLVLSSRQYNLTKALADTILPKTQSPSASEVKVPEFMDLLLQDVFNEEKRIHIVHGLEKFDINCQSSTGKPFSELSNEERLNYLSPVDREIMGRSYPEKIPFYFTFKKLCLSIYYSTEEGIKQNLNYQPIPGSYQGDRLLSNDEIISVGNEM